MRHVTDAPRQATTFNNRYWCCGRRIGEEHPADCPIRHPSGETQQAVQLFRNKETIAQHGTR